MNRRAFVSGLGAVLLAPPAVKAQQMGKIWRVGDLSTGAAEVALAATWASFVQGLRESGYVEGVTVTFERRSARGAPNRLPELASDLVRRNVDIIFARGPWAVLCRGGRCRAKGRPTWAGGKASGSPESRTGRRCCACRFQRCRYLVRRE